ncbi:MAG: ESX-1 secretion-associated protein [Mycobacterium sp.]|nr:ESX-1 secretion-associated protein [Mycobacterium sp.]
MSREALQVSTAHLRALADRHGQAAAQITAAVTAVSGIDTGIRTSHGVIASATAGAVAAIEQARSAAGAGMMAESRALSDDLTGAAGRYEATDHTSGVSLDQQIQDGPTPR